MKRIIRNIRNFFVQMGMASDDEFWYSTGGDGRPYPPSFYATHTEEEIQEITQKDQEKLNVLMKKYEIKKGQSD